MRFPLLKILLLVILLSALACHRYVAPLPDSQNSADDWRMAGVNAARTSYVPHALPLPLAEIARVKLSSAATENLFVHNGALIVPTLDGRLATFDLTTKRFLSKKKMPGGHAGTLALKDGKMVFAMRYGKETLLYYDLARRNTLWEIDAGDIASEPLVGDSCIFVAALYEHLDAYARQDGARRWQFRTKGQLHGSPALAEDVLIAATDRGKIYALNANSGQSIWEADLAQPILSTPVIAAEQVFIGTARDLLAAFDLHTGAEKWRVQCPGRIFNAAAVNDSLVIFGASDGVVRALRRTNGALAWSFRAASSIGTVPLIVGDNVFFGALDKNVYGLQVSTGALQWQWTLEGRVRTNPLVWQNRLIIASEDRYLYVFGPEEKMEKN